MPANFKTAELQSQKNASKSKKHIRFEDERNSEEIHKNVMQELLDTTPEVQAQAVSPIQFKLTNEDALRELNPQLLKLQGA